MGVNYLMAWTTPKTDWEALDVPDEDDMNAIGENLEALKDPAGDINNVNEASNFTTTSTSFATVHAATTASITTTGGRVLVTFTGSCTHSQNSGAIYFNLQIDGSGDYAANDGIFLQTITTAGQVMNCSFLFWVEGLSAGAHTIALRWKVGSGTATMYAGAGTSNLDVHPQFAAVEVS